MAHNAAYPQQIVLELVVWKVELIPDSEAVGIRARPRLVLDLWDFGAEERGRSFRNDFVPSL
jgi:hypothetical protein